MGSLMLVTSVDDLIKRCFHCGGEVFSTSGWLAFGSIQLIRCDGCKLLHLYPIQMHDDGVESLGDTETERQMDLADEADDTGINHGNGILDLIEGYKKKGRILDIGCKHGALLEAAQSRDWEPVGLDVNPDFCDVVRNKGFEVYNSFLENLDTRVKPFDVITLSHVLEHIERPDITLQAANERLNPGGLLYIETPDVSSPIAWGIYRGRWLGVTTPGHVWAYTTQTLQKVIAKQRYDIVWSNRWIPYAPHDYPSTVKGQTRRILFTAINKLGYGDIVGVLARKAN